MGRIQWLGYSGCGTTASLQGCWRVDVQPNGRRMVVELGQSYEVPVLKNHWSTASGAEHCCRVGVQPTVQVLDHSTWLWCTCLRWVILAFG